MLLMKSWMKSMVHVITLSVLRMLSHRRLHCDYETAERFLLFVCCPTTRSFGSTSNRFCMLRASSPRCLSPARFCEARIELFKSVGCCARCHVAQCMWCSCRTHVHVTCGPWDATGAVGRRQACVAWTGPCRLPWSLLPGHRFEASIAVRIEGRRRSTAAARRPAVPPAGR